MDFVEHLYLTEGDPLSVSFAFVLLVITYHKEVEDVSVFLKARTCTSISL